MEEELFLERIGRVEMKVWSVLFLAEGNGGMDIGIIIGMGSGGRRSNVDKSIRTEASLDSQVRKEHDLRALSDCNDAEQEEV
ncbi:hypothetical protein CHS0354_022898 [Potamilus streckersoni]|uniref:Uncharacterized protein n=1 Tax=Potamilus streckersoni TaxID=2493646 RepID=A0AAE0S1W5_9BIVA|nr:hypothetical protein CHS0354_022898 [Potamilus streckersoni]